MDKKPFVQYYYTNNYIAKKKQGPDYRVGMKLKLDKIEK